MHLKHKNLLAAIAIPLFAGMGCSSSDSKPAPISGQLINMSGINYVTSSGVQGQTDSSGEFTYKKNDIISFFVGGVKIGEAKGEAILTPLHFFDDPNVSTSTTRVTDITRFLIAIDEDEFTGNGIQVSDDAHSLAANVNADYSDTDIAFDYSAADNLVFAISNTKTNPFITSLTVDTSAGQASTYLNTIIETTGPVVVHTTPSYRNDENLNVYPSLGSIDVRFASSIQPETVDTNSFTVTNSSGTAVTGTVTASGLGASFDPSTALTNGSTYTVSLASSILDNNDMPFPSDYSFQFTVANAQTTAVECIDSNKLNTNVSQNNAVITVNFNLVDCSGNAITGLTASDFNFFEGANKDPVFNDDYETYRGYPATGFQTTSNAMTIIIDNSTSVTDTEFTAYINQAKQIIATGTDHNSNLIEGQSVAIYTFDNGLTFEASSQSSLDLWTTLDALATTRPASDQTTGFYAAINSAANNLGSSGNTNKKTLVILSDAIDTAGTTDFNTAFNTVNNNDISVFLLTQNSNIDAVDSLAFNEITDVTDIKTDALAMKADAVNFINSQYTFQYATPKRSGWQDVMFEVIGNSNLSDDDTTITNAFWSTGLSAPAQALRLDDGSQAIVVDPQSSETVIAVSEFAPTSSSYQYTSGSPANATVALDSSTGPSAAIVSGATNNTSADITINDATNNLSSTFTAYIGPKYEWSFEDGSLQGWSADAGWGVKSIDASERRNGSDFALSIPTTGVYASSANANLTSPAFDLSRFTGGNPALSFKYKHRNADSGDNVQIQLLDGASNVVATLGTVSSFIHNWTNVTLDVSAYTGTAKALRFVFTSDATGQYEGFQVDDIKIYPTQ